MEYTVKQVAQISGVSVRTLHYYDEIDLLKPAKVNESGYRIYEQTQIDTLQQILFYKYLGFDLEHIKTALSADDFSNVQALQKHQEKLLQQRDQINLLLNTVEKTLKSYEGDKKMTNEEKFSAFKQQQIADNEAKYGTEIRNNYGDDVINESNKKYESLTASDLQEMKDTEQLLLKELDGLTQLSDVKNETGKQVFELHKKWLTFSWTSYSAEAHKGLADMYLADKRFAKYYNEKVNERATLTLHDAIHYYA